MRTKLTSEYLTLQNNDSENALNLSHYYKSEGSYWTPPPSITYKNDKGNMEEIEGVARIAKPSIFNRYSIFFLNTNQPEATEPEEYLDGREFSTVGNNTVHNRRRVSEQQLKVEKNPTASNIIEWSKSGNNNAVDYSWEDFLWCSKYGEIPNNYMITLRRFPAPVDDDITNSKFVKSPDIARMITWVDGKKNTWANVGLSWKHGMKWKPLTAAIQNVTMPSKSDGTSQVGAFTSSLPGGGLISDYVTKGFKAISTKNVGDLSSGQSSIPYTQPYEDQNSIWGPVDSINSMQVRELGLNFAQDIKLEFEYELKSIDGINPKVAMMDLMSNVLVCTSNKGNFWGGDHRFFGTSSNNQRISPLGDVSLMRSGDLMGWLKTAGNDLFGRMKNFFGGGFKEFFGNVSQSMQNSFLGKILNDMGESAPVALNSLLTGENTGEWHITIGNPANPIVSVGNLILKDTEVKFDGFLGVDDFPSKVIVTCSLEPARPRDRIDIMKMFHKNNRTYLTEPSQASVYAGNIKSTQGQSSGRFKRGEVMTKFTENDLNIEVRSNIKDRFPNHFNRKSSINDSAKNIG